MKIVGSGSVDAEGRRTGRWTFDYATGERYASGAFEAGIRVGEWTYWYPGGGAAARGAHLHDGATPTGGPWVYFHPNGVEAMRVEYDDLGLESGEAREWYDNGQLARVTHYDMSDEHGPTTSWHRNGATMIEGTVECDTHVGTWRFWHDSGQLAFVEVRGETEPAEGFFDPAGRTLRADEFWSAYVDTFSNNFGCDGNAFWPEGKLAGHDIWAPHRKGLEHLGVVLPLGSELLDEFLRREWVEAQPGTYRRFAEYWRQKKLEESEDSVDPT